MNTLIKNDITPATVNFTTLVKNSNTTTSLNIHPSLALLEFANAHFVAKQYFDYIMKIDF